MADPCHMDDAAFLHRVLSDGRWHRQMDIIATSIRDRGFGMTVHSRASTLRERGYVVENRQHVENGRRVSEYRLLGATRESGVDGKPLSRVALDSGPPEPSSHLTPEEDGLVGPGVPPKEVASGPTQLSVFEAVA